MPVSYDDIVNAELGSLEDAAKSWSSMGTRFGTLQDNYSDHVRAAADSDTWSGYAAAGYKNWGQTTTETYGQAKAEAQGVAALLRLAHATLTQCKKEVEAARDAAVDAGMDVNSQGHCTMNFDKVAEKKGEKTADKYRDDAKAKAEAEEKYTADIQKAVKKTQEADHSLKTDFMADPKQSGKGMKGGFNGNIGHDIVKRNARRTAATLKAVRDGEKPSPDELREAAILSRAHDEDPEYSRTLINSLGGADGLLRTHNRLDDLAYYDDKDHRKSYLSLDKELASNLATATRNPSTDFYKKFHQQMLKAGTKEYDLKAVGEPERGRPGQGQKIRGYQSLVSLMQRGDNYTRELLVDTADAIRNAEDKSRGGNPDIWDLQGDFSGKKYNHFAADPYDGMLKIISDSPDLATDYLDPDENDNLEYALKERSWKHVDMGETAPDGSDPDKESKGAREGLGRIIEAGATGELPGSHHELGSHEDPAQARVMYRTIKELNASGQAQEMPENLRQPLARTLKDYVPDLHEILGNHNPIYKEREGVWEDEGLARMSALKDDLVPVMRGIAEDPEAFGSLYQAQKQYGQDRLAELPDNAGKDTRVAIGETASAMGAYDGVRADIVFDKRYDSQTWANDFNTAVTTAPGYALNFTGAYTPAADAVNRLIGVYSYEATKQRLAEAALEATEENAKQFTAGQTEVSHMVAKWAESNGHKQDDTFTKDLIGPAQTKHEEGRDGALRPLRSDY